MPKRECKCKRFDKVDLETDSYHIVYIKDDPEIPIECPLCGDKIRFQLPTYIPKKQARRYTDKILSILNEANKKKKQARGYLDAKV